MKRWVFGCAILVLAGGCKKEAPPAPAKPATEAGPAKGEAKDAPVTLRSRGDKAPGVWGGLRLLGNASRSVREGVVIEHAGLEGPAVEVPARGGNDRLPQRGLRLLQANQVDRPPHDAEDHAQGPEERVLREPLDGQIHVGGLRSPCPADEGAEEDHAPHPPVPPEHGGRLDDTGTNRSGGSVSLRAFSREPRSP